MATRERRRREEQELKDAEVASLQTYALVQQENQEERDIREAEQASLELLQQQRLKDQDLRTAYASSITTQVGRGNTRSPPQYDGALQSGCRPLLAGIEEYRDYNITQQQRDSKPVLKGGAQSGVMFDSDDDELPEMNISNIFNDFLRATDSTPKLDHFPTNTKSRAISRRKSSSNLASGGIPKTKPKLSRMSATVSNENEEPIQQTAVLDEEGTDFVDKGTDPWDAGNDHVNQAYDPSKPFRFMDCPSNIRDRILQYVLIDDHVLRPTYHVGSVEVERAHDYRDNYDISMLIATAGNLKLYEEACCTLYGGNVFYFWDPREMLWWVKKIGKNLQKVQILQLELCKGEVPAQMSPVFGEKLWYNAFLWLKSRHKLESLMINFEWWNQNDIREEQDLDVLEARKSAYTTLLKYRELRHVEIVPGSQIHEGFASHLVTAMAMKAGESNEDIKEIEHNLRPRGKKYSMA